MYVAPQRMRVGEYLLERWLPAIEQTIRPTTYSGYTRHIQRYVVPRIGALLLQDLTPDRPSVLDRDLVAGGGVNGRPLAPNTVRRIHAALHRAFRDAVARGYMLRNQAAMASKPKAQSPGSVQMRIWTAEELRRFLAHVCRGPTVRRLAVGVLDRHAAQRDPRPALDRRRPRRRSAGGAPDVHERRRRDDVREPKTSRSKRTVALDVETVRALSSWRTTQPEERLLWADAWEDFGLVHPRERSADPSGCVLRALGKVRDFSGLPSIRF